MNCKSDFLEIETIQKQVLFPYRRLDQDFPLFVPDDSLAKLKHKQEIKLRFNFALLQRECDI